MENSFYEYFNCDTKEELYLKLKSGSEETKELAEYIEFQKQNKPSNSLNIKNGRALIEYLKNNLPQKDEIQILMFNTNTIVNDKIFSKDLPFKEIMKECFVPEAARVMIVSGGAATDTLQENLESLNYKILDSIVITEDLELFSKTNDMAIAQLTEEDLILKREKKSKNNEKYNKESYNEFIDYYTKQEIIGLNIIKDNEKIKEILRLANKDLSQERFGIIEYDKDCNIKNINYLFVGGLNEAVVDPRNIIPHILKEDVRGIEVFHNHPSGKIAPSRQDIATTEIIEKMCKLFDKEITDHFVVGKEGIFSFREESLSTNMVDDYNKKKIEVTEKKEKTKEMKASTNKTRVRTRSRAAARGNGRE